MTIDEQKATGQPRLLIRTFWVIHKTVVRLSGGSVGLWRPRIGKRFGVMALKTVGRRSGSERLVIVGYFQDDSNAVTLAMNGWADAEPDWWLNLQAQPDATVVLPSGPRLVRARAARGEEHERLWALVGDYPGWGDNVDLLAARRAMSTTVVVFEPRSGTGSTD